MARLEEQQDLLDAFCAGYGSALGLVERECGRPALQKLALSELVVLLRRQQGRQRLQWQQGRLR